MPTGNRKIHRARRRRVRFRSIRAHYRSQHRARSGASVQFADTNRSSRWAKSVMVLRSFIDVEGLCARLQFGADRSRGARVSAAKAEMHNLSSQEVLSRDEPGTSSSQETASPDKTAHRKSRPRRLPK